MLRQDSFCTHALATTPAEPLERSLALLSAMSAFPDFRAGRPPHCSFRGLLSVHSRWACVLAESPLRSFSIGGFSRFVTSTTAPIATGWSDRCRVGIMSH